MTTSLVLLLPLVLLVLRAAVAAGLQAQQVQLRAALMLAARSGVTVRRQKRLRAQLPLCPTAAHSAVLETSPAAAGAAASLMAEGRRSSVVRLMPSLQAPCRTGAARPPAALRLALLLRLRQC